MKSDQRLTPARNKSWTPGQKGQGGEGLSKGYGGSAGHGTGTSGPDTDQPGQQETPPVVRKVDDKEAGCLPSKERIEKVLR